MTPSAAATAMLMQWQRDVEAKVAANPALAQSAALVGDAIYEFAREAKSAAAKEG
jgi:hypothetical protein